MIQREPIFCRPFSTKEEILEGISADLAACAGFDAKINFIAPEESSANPEFALHTRLSILLRTYRGDYHTDSFDFEHLAQRIVSGKEMIWFWGEEGEVEKYRRGAAKGKEPDDELLLGTVTILDGSAEFGTGYGELCRSGSMDFSLGGKAPILHRTLDYMMERGPWSRKYHTLVLVPRNRKSDEEVRGGEAVNRIHVHYVRSRFWGVAPWYVMQGGSMEMLDFRESNRDPQHVREALKESPPWFVASEESKIYLQSLCRLNFSVSPEIRVEKGEGRLPNCGGTLHLPSEALRRENHGMILAEENRETGLPLSEAVEEAEKSGICTSVVRLRPDHPDSVELQQWLEARGYRLMSLSPPKKTWIESGKGREEIRTGPAGFWCRTLHEHKIEKPYYLEKSPGSREEENVLKYIESL